MSINSDQMNHIGESLVNVRQSTNSINVKLDSLITSQGQTLQVLEEIRHIVSHASVTSVDQAWLNSYNMHNTQTSQFDFSPLLQVINTNANVISSLTECLPADKQAFVVFFSACSAALHTLHDSLISTSSTTPIDSVVNTLSTTPIDSVVNTLSTTTTTTLSNNTPIHFPNIDNIKYFKK
jgi:hypothetical protein